MPPLLALLLPVAATLLGGWIVLRTRQTLRPWLSLSGGVLLGLAFLDLLPEAFEHAGEAGLSGEFVGGMALATVLLFHVLDKVFDFHGHEGHEHPCANTHHEEHPARPWTRISGMGFHAFLDGLAIGGGFAANERLGILVTLGLMLHKLTDGMTTVTLFAKSGGSERRSRTYVALSAIVLLPLFGLATGQFLTPSPMATTLFLSALAGLFIHLPLSELLPEAHEGKPSRLGIALTVAGITLIALIKQLVPHG